ncbi:OPT oligopeptide transporter protein-domain-containing protein [Cristinia sonorae]|uniref:OPT oligopeptide transporter protein-domain-containing protein n=1 Tax=Cristinia sonorae TaxID=1940300 RepID=A0A8K0UIQ0_9AGAR|nr:OPT oligopeptide transporter protein-domain-containing protein [Cristinia sonorae]
MPERQIPEDHPHGATDMVAPTPVIPILDSPHNEKHPQKESPNAVGDKQYAEYDEKSIGSVVDSEDLDVRYVNGEPVITTGRDVSKYVVDIRDDGDPAITFRSLFLGTVFAGLGATLFQIYQFKPVEVSVSTVFLLLLIYSIGILWAKCLPTASIVEGTRFAKLAPVIHFINPGPFGLKEHTISALVASTAASGSTSVMNFAVQRLFYDTNVSATTAVLATFSTGLFGYGVVGLLRPLTVYPSEMVYWRHLPTVSIFQALHYDSAANAKRLKLFWLSFSGMFAFEIIPAYIFPLLSGVNIVCLATQKAPASAVNVITNLFGGTNGNEGLGFGSISFDWQAIGSAYVSLPLIQQANSWIGFAFCYIAIMAIYYSNTWNALSFPMLSSSIFAANGSRYKQNAVFDQTFTLNETALKEVGIPSLTGSYVWYNLTGNLAIGGLIAHCVWFWSPYVWASVKSSMNGTQSDPHYKAMQKYNEVPWYWYGALIVLSFFAGLIVVIKGETTLPWWSYIIALIVGAAVAPFSNLLYARVGNGINTTNLCKMVAAACNPGKPVANLYFSMWSHDVIVQAIALGGDLKMGQYLKIPPRAMFLTQIWGVVIGAVVNYVVMVSVVEAQREILIHPLGTNVWSGQQLQSMNSAAVTWSLADKLYGPHSPYFIVILSLIIGVVPTTIQYFIYRRWPVIGGIRLDSVILPIIYMYSARLYVGVTSMIFSCIIVGVVSQLWLRKYHPGWYRKYNYILGGALDGGAQVMIFVLSFAVFGASGKSNPFPSWAGNPAKGNMDYCNGNGALDK